MKQETNFLRSNTRRHFFQQTGFGLGSLALSSLLNDKLLAQDGKPHLAPKAKNIIYLFMAGGPSQLDLFDYKPALIKHDGEDCPAEYLQGERFAFTKGVPKLQATPFSFKQHGQSGNQLSEVIPHLAQHADDLTIIRSMKTTQFNHAPAQIFMNTGHQIAGRPSFGSWLSYGLGSENKDLPAFVVLVSVGSGRPDCQPLYDRLWGSGFLPSQYQGVKFQSGADKVHFLSNPPGINKQVRGDYLDALAKLNQENSKEFGDPEVLTRIAQYEMAYRMQTSVPDLTDLSKESEKTMERYGPDAKKPGTYAANCILARRLAERGVRCIQLFHRGWDQHADLPKAITGQCRDTDQPTAALLMDLKERGMLDDTLIVWGGEFGRTVYSQGKLTETNYGRDHHPRAFTIWLAGGGIKPGISIGETDDFSYNITRDPIHVHDLNATILHCLGVDHKRLTYKYQGRNFRLTDVHGEVIKQILL